MTMASGENHHAAKLTWKDVDAIRAAAEAGETVRRIAQRYPVSGVMVHKIITGQSWKTPRDVHA